MRNEVHMMPGGGDPGHKRLLDGMHRTRTPDETLAEVLPIRHRFGITRVANVTGLDRIGLPVVLATRPNSRSVAVSQGKGTTLDAAKASAVMEAIELWHAENILRPMIFAARSEIDRCGTAIDVERLPRIVGSRYADSLRLHWIEATDLISGRSVLIPHEMVHTDYTHPLSPGQGCFPASTNGLASGNHLLEAICHAVCEVIERDAITVWHHRPAAVRAATMVDPETIDCMVSRRLLSVIEGAGLGVALWDATSDIGVATFYCLISDNTDPGGHMGLGSGTHPDRGVALARALTEAVQTRMNYITGSRDDLGFEEYTAEGRAQKAGEAKALVRKATPSRDFTTAPSRVAGTFRDDLDWLVERLGACGVNEIACADLSSHLPNLAIVRVVIPGLEAPHDDDTFAPGPRALAAAHDLT